MFKEKEEVKFPNSIRYFNKHVLNRLTGKVARSAWGPFTLVCHVGRRSGKNYETPIIAIPAGGGFLVALTYGPDVDWYRNIMAAGKCSLLWHHHEYTIEKIEPMDRKKALPHFPRFERMVLGLFGIQHFVRMKGSGA